MKKFYNILYILIMFLILGSCGNNLDNNGPIKLNSPTIYLNADMVYWDKVDNASSYIVSNNGKEIELSDVCYYIDDTIAGDYVIKVKAISLSDDYIDSDYSNEVTYIIKPNEPEEEVKPNEPEEEVKPNEPEDLIDYNNSIFASPDGNGNGSYLNPYSLTSAINNLKPGKILYLLGGIYNCNSVIKLSKFGNEENYYSIYAFKDEKVVLDFGKDYSKEQILQGNYNKDIAKGIVITGNYYHIKGISITHSGSYGMQIRGSYNIAENCIFAYNGNTGCGISGSSSNPYEQWPHDNLVKNCTSYGNYDWDRLDGMQGEDADGFGCKLTTGDNNVFDGCIAYNNSDDGWDLFTKHLTGAIGEVTIKNCVAYRNGYSFSGEEMKNGQGFKLGGRAIGVSHYVENCVAFYNKSNGFDDNSNTGTITIKNCTSYKNGSRNYAMGRFLEENNTYTSTWYEDDILFGPINDVPKTNHNFVNCLSFDSGLNDAYSGKATNCYFHNANGKYVMFNNEEVCNSKYKVGVSVNANNPFVSTEIDLNDYENVHYLYRNTDYSVNLKDFLKITESFRDLNLGCNLNA